MESVQHAAIIRNSRKIVEPDLPNPDPASLVIIYNQQEIFNGDLETDILLEDENGFWWIYIFDNTGNFSIHFNENGEYNRNYDMRWTWYSRGDTWEVMDLDCWVDQDVYYWSEVFAEEPIETLLELFDATDYVPRDTPKSQTSTHLYPSRGSW
jgi:hypothetical protein